MTADTLPAMQKLPPDLSLRLVGSPVNAEELLNLLRALLRDDRLQGASHTGPSRVRISPYC